jgi:hypothetical protein
VVQKELDFYQETQVLLSEAVDKFVQNPADVQLSKDYSQLVQVARERQSVLEIAVKEVVSERYQKSVLEIAEWSLINWDIQRQLLRSEAHIAMLKDFEILPVEVRRKKAQELVDEKKLVVEEFQSARNILPDYVELAWRRDKLLTKAGILSLP